MHTTPMMRQWAQIKQQFPGTLVLFRLGDFYEAFQEDAVTLSTVCDVTLTSRPVQKGERTPMAGVPYHAVDSYIAQLVRQGHRVAIVEQTGADSGPEKRARMSGSGQRGRPGAGARGIDQDPAAGLQDVPELPLDPSALANDPSERSTEVSDRTRASSVESLGRAETGRGATLMGREVVRVVTPGTLVEHELLDSRANNFLAAIYLEPRKGRAGDDAFGIGLAYADITTGEFATMELVGEDPERAVQDELVRLRPAELLVPETWSRQDADRGGARGGVPTDAQGGGPTGAPSAGARLMTQLGELLPTLGLPTRTVPFSRWRFDLANARRTLLEHFGTANLAAFGCEEQPLATIAAGAVLAYLQETQRGAVAQITTLATLGAGEHMVLDAATRRNLELVTTLRGDAAKGAPRGTLMWAVDLTQTPMGARLLRRWMDQPLLVRGPIEERLDAVDALVREGALREALRRTLKNLPDLERLVHRITGGYAGPRELLTLAKGLRQVMPLGQLLAESPGLPSLLAGRCQQPVGALVAQIEATIADEPPAVLGLTGVIRPGRSAELDAIHASVSDARGWIAGLEAHERARTGIKKLKVGYNKVFGYYIEVTRSQADSAAGLPSDYLRKQTLVDSERYITPELKERELEVQSAEDRILALERSLFGDLVRAIEAIAPLVVEAARDAGHVDAFAGLAEAAVQHRYVRPTLTDGRDLVIRGGRHPVIERMRPDASFVPNDVEIRAGEIVLLTGPNMAGKSTVGRQTALTVLMAQMGSFVPADSAEIGIVDRIFTRIGAQDEITAGQSTFMVEMMETANILHHATSRSLIILDELGRGTSTYDGMAIAWAVIEYIHSAPRLGARTLFATHFHELTTLSDRLPRVRNVSMSVAETPDGGIAFLHRVVPGAADRSYGIHVAELAGLPRPVVARGWEILRELESTGHAPLQVQTPGSAPDAGPATPSGQLALFAPAPTPAEVRALEQLRSLDLDQLTPVEAMLQIIELQRRLNS